MAAAQRQLRMGMVGGGRDAFIGAVHRKAAALDGRIALVAGALSSSPEKAVASGKDLGLPDDRNYPNWKAMLEGERRRARFDRVDFVSIVTPNDQHYAVARAFVDAGVHVICDKPLCTNTLEARELVKAVGAADGGRGLVFAVTYNYSGYPMVKQARHMVRQGALSDIRKVIVEYNQGWLASALEKTGQKQADWRTDPRRSGAGGAIGDIGSHCEQLVSYVTGLEIESICADLTSFVPGRKLDDDANVLLRFKGGARGILTASQIEVGHENDLRIRVFGARGSLEWCQEEPNQLWHKPDGRPVELLTRGNAYLCDAAKKGTRLPPGHPEAFIEAFANVYLAAAAAILDRESGGTGLPGECDYPGVTDGARGVHFIEKTVESGKSDRKWTDARWAV
jgi:predicted dehydrogenase